ncbi:hypothetical protein HGRIS_013265 [Hohenbuehelia grisea]|uniref:mRNA cap guanine-N(7) methyltransferase n=1 Tax=Hohenbuehelia grisea TaxID=104357 RepID=A0ABR3IUW9_9AGAR
MPAFDPVRDAVLNSPVTQTDSPTLHRRATDLSVLLNATDDDKYHPHHTPHHYDAVNDNDNEEDEDKLVGAEPLRRQSLFGDSPIAETKPLPSPSPSESSMPPPSRRSSIPYNPRKRITPPSSILVPMSPEELQMFKDYRGVGTEKLLKRKRSSTPHSERAEQPPAKRLAGDVGVVVQHYNARPDVGVIQRQDSPIIGLKNFNNWVKSVLITRFAHPAFAASPSSGPGRGGRGKVLDMGCGKGGDLTKWSKARIRELVGVDIAAVSVDQARSRWETMRPPRFAATFAALDCYTELLSAAFPPARLAEPFDAVSMQFCMHYAFETEKKARCMLENVVNWLRPGGIFVGTIPNAEQLLDQLDAIPPDQEDLSFGNSVYKIRFEDRNKTTYGHKYWFYLQDAVENVPEYVVQWDNFVQLAREYGLEPRYKAEFHQVYEQHQEHPEFKPLLTRMKVVDSHGDSSMDEVQWEAANIYIAFAFERKR